ncbi:hypothetical protein TWF694_003676 [Orbilia ellipsospora]|uniref:Uncharacterized protein n=1 Tax=Orbilia ellipsospora TaxID=2528407 RepID=A0AAV9X147_9PEZI
MNVSTTCKHGTFHGFRCETCDNFVCSLRRPPKDLDFPELLIPPYLTPREINPPTMKSMPPELGYSKNELHAMGALGRDYRWRLTAAAKQNEERAIFMAPGKSPGKRVVDPLSILSPLRKLRIVSPERGWGDGVENSHNLRLRDKDYDHRNEVGLTENIENTKNDTNREGLLNEDGKSDEGESVERNILPANR